MFGLAPINDVLTSCWRSSFTPYPEREKIMGNLVGLARKNLTYMTVELEHDKSDKMTCTQQRLRSAWASAQSEHEQSLLCTLCFFRQTAKTDKTGQMPRLILVFAWCTIHFVHFVMLRLNNGIPENTTGNNFITSKFYCGSLERKAFANNVDLD